MRRIFFQFISFARGSVKSIFTGYLLTIGLGTILASPQILVTYGMADGKLGLSLAIMATQKTVKLKPI